MGNKILSNSNSRMSSAHQSEATKSKKDPKSSMDERVKSVRTNKSYYSFHTKNNPSDAQLLEANALTISPPKPPDSKRSTLRRKKSILPMNYGDKGMIAQTTEGFSLQKFMEKNQQKHNEVTQKIEGKLSF